MASHRPSPPAPLSKRERDGHWYVPGKEPHERDHVFEHETIQKLQKLALTGKHEECWELLGLGRGEDKRRDIIELCQMNDTKP